MTSTMKPMVAQLGAGFLLLLGAIRTRSVTRHSYAGSRSVRASQKIELWLTRQPQNSESGIVAERLAESRLSGVWQEPGHSGCSRCEPSRADSGITRMSLARYSLASWPPPEPASASPAKKTKVHLDRSACLKNAKAQAAQGVVAGASTARSAASRYPTSLRATSRVARLSSAPAARCF